MLKRPHLQIQDLIASSHHADLAHNAGQQDNLEGPA